MESTTPLIVFGIIVACVAIIDCLWPNQVSGQIQKTFDIKEPLSDLQAQTLALVKEAVERGNYKQATSFLGDYSGFEVRLSTGAQVKFDLQLGLFVLDMEKKGYDLFREAQSFTLVQIFRKLHEEKLKREHEAFVLAEAEEFNKKQEALLGKNFQKKNDVRAILAKIS